MMARMIKIDPDGVATVMDREASMDTVRAVLDGTEHVHMTVLHRTPPIIVGWMDTWHESVNKPNYLARWLVERMAGIHGFLTDMDTSVYNGTVLLTGLGDGVDSIVDGLTDQAEEGVMQMISSLGGILKVDGLGGDL